MPKDFEYCEGCDNTACLQGGCMGRGPGVVAAALTLAAGVRRRLPNRRDGLTVTVSDGRLLFDVSIGFFDDDQAHVAELFFEGRGTVGQDRYLMLGQIGLEVSRALQIQPPVDRVVVDPIELPPTETRYTAIPSPPIVVTFERFPADHARAGDLSTIGIAVPDHSGYDAQFGAIARDLTLILRNLPSPRRIEMMRPGAPLLLGREAWAARLRRDLQADITTIPGGAPDASR